MKTRQWLAVAALGAAAMGAQAQGLYAELGYTNLKATAEGFSVKPEGLRLIVGYDINEFLAAEGMVGLGISKGRKFHQNNTVTAELDHSVGVFLRPRFNLTDDFEVFGRAGWARSKMSASATKTGLSGSQSGTDFAYGVGVSLRINPTWSLNADYMNYFSRGGLRVNGYTVGVGMRF